MPAYLDLSPTDTDTATVSITVGDSSTNQWKIKVRRPSTVQHSTVQYSVVQVSQYSCDDEYVAAQIGCFQYFTGLTGTLQSYNFAGAAQIKVQTRLLQCCSAAVC